MDWLRERLQPSSQDELLLRSYRYYRAQEIILGKVIGRLQSLAERFPGLFGDQAAFDRTIGLYEGLHADALKRRDTAAARLGGQFAAIDGVFSRTALLKAEQRALGELLEDEMLPRKIGAMLSRDLESEAEKAPAP